MSSTLESATARSSRPPEARGGDSLSGCRRGLRERIGQIGIAAARAVGYRSAGTLEGLLDRDGNYFFLEMNTRIQVEHTITEAVAGVDIVRAQVQIAAGERLEFAQDEIRLQGHAIECRINAEDPLNAFPSPGRITSYREPGGPGVRVDSGVAAGSEVVGLYDPLISKLIVQGVDREHARRRMLRALDEYEIQGITTLLGFHRALLRRDCFVAGQTCEGIVESKELAEEAERLSHGTTNIPTSPDGRLRERVSSVELDGRLYEVRALIPETPFAELARRRRPPTRGGAHHPPPTDAVRTPLQGQRHAVEVADGDGVRAGQVICIIEAVEDGETRSRRTATA